jgi:hypothetical protein
MVLPQAGGPEVGALGWLLAGGLVLFAAGVVLGIGSRLGRPRRR